MDFKEQLPKYLLVPYAFVFGILGIFPIIYIIFFMMEIVIFRLNCNEKSCFVKFFHEWKKNYIKTFDSKSRLRKYFFWNDIESNKDMNFEKCTYNLFVHHKNDEEKCLGHIKIFIPSMRDILYFVLFFIILFIFSPFFYSLIGLHLLWWLCHLWAFLSFCGIQANQSMKELQKPQRKTKF